MKNHLIAIAALMLPMANASSADIGAAHAQFVTSFNERQWDAVKEMLTDDSVFHRANGDSVFIGPEAIVERWSSTIGAADQWNVKFAKLNTTAQLTGKDGRVVERGDFAVTAGGDSSSCYAGSFMMTWAQDNDGNWGLQTLAWQDVETEITDCK